MQERNQIILKLILAHFILVPVLILFSFFHRTGSLLVLPIAQCILIIILMAGYWEFFSKWFKWSFILFCEVMILVSAGTRIASAYIVRPSSVWIVVLSIALAASLFLLIRILIVIFKKDPERLEIEFPFKDGEYMVTDGGDSSMSRMMNYHYHSSVHKKKGTNKSMRYATDVVKLSGMSSGFLPLKNEDYPIFGEKLFAPMDGIVVQVKNDIEDNRPFTGNYPYNTGNTIVLKKDDYYFLLGHLKKGSITIHEGDQVKSGDMIGMAGNSGMSERPHLHAQLMKSESGEFWKGMGICIQWKGRNLYKNRILHI